MEKIKRDVKITTIYEGTSEIQQLIISTSRWRDTVRSKGLFYGSLAEQMDAVHETCGDVRADMFAALARLLNRLFDEVHQAKLTRQQHIMFRLATLTTLVETGAALCRKAAQSAGSSENGEYVKLCARINAALSAQEAFAIANEIAYGSGQWSTDEARAILESSSFDYAGSQTGLISDMDLLRTRI